MVGENERRACPLPARTLPRLKFVNQRPHPRMPIHSSPRMHHQTIAKYRLISAWNRQALVDILVFLKIVHTESIRGEKPISAHVPV